MQGCANGIKAYVSMRNDFGNFHLGGLCSNFILPSAVHLEERLTVSQSVS